MRGSLRGLCDRAPEQSSAAEWLDDDGVDPGLLADNLRDIARAGRLLGAERLIQQRVAAWADLVPPSRAPVVLDIATGRGDLPLRLYGWSRQHGRRLVLVASDVSAAVLREARQRVADQPIALVRHDALALPFGDNAVDIVTCMQSLHHFDRDVAARLLRECARVARIGVIISDLRRSYLAYWGARLFGCVTASPLSRHDGPLSVLRAYTPAEIEELTRDLGVRARLRARALRLDVELRGSDAVAIRRDRA